ncbi:ferrochelatase [Catalinimonas alkaloidigena]|uniref:ferrochelatase n=1 Tax=Catalinimonas alkaloidigena TaxID=1075417 RepID=UPI0024059403|nr:ferrochelatase [Catalinimonas alkaloidigena]MDF9800893.1 ferrochelatase [Catalinimonas alkaloidigena]
MKKPHDKVGVLLVNLGTPDSPKTGDVRRYLREFLMDWRVVDYPLIPRWMLVNLIIAPFRAPKSAKEYQKLWQERGSPLKFYGEDVTQLLQDSLGDRYVVKLAMRYQKPSIKSVLEELQKEMVSSIICIPLFPQYASATSGSVIDKVMEITRNWQVIPELKFISQFPDHPLFIEAHAQQARKLMDKQEYDHYVFSYHGVPVSQIKKASYEDYCQVGSCCNKYGKKNQYCYRAQCFQTSRVLAKKLGIPEEKYTVSFQSRLGPVPWIRPYTDEVLEELAKEGKKKVLALSPAFVADCLETTLEVGEEYKHDFLDAGGEVWDLVESLNDHSTWIACLEDLVLKNDANTKISEEKIPNKKTSDELSSSISRQRL